MHKHPKLIITVIVTLFLTALVIYNPSTFNYWTQFWWMFPVAFMIALTVNTLGISGAALFVPFFILIFPLFADSMSAVQSVRVGLVTESFGLSSSAIAFLVFGLVDKKLAFYSILGAMPLVIAGTFMTEMVPQSVLYLMIAVLLIVAIALVYYKKIIAKHSHDERHNSKIDYLVPEGERVQVTAADHKEYKYCRTKKGYKQRFFGYGIGGFFQGAAGFGIGEIGIISMILSNIPTRIAIGTSTLIVSSTAIIASIMHVLLSSSSSEPLPWNLIFMTVPAVVIGGQLAPYVSSKLKTELLEKALVLLFFVIAVALIALALGFSSV